MPASSSSPTAVLVDDSDPELGELGQVPAAPPGLWQCLQKVTDLRKRRGLRHPITGVLAVALAATLAGASAAPRTASSPAGRTTSSPSRTTSAISASS